MTIFRPDTSSAAGRGREDEYLARSITNSQKGVNVAVAPPPLPWRAEGSPSRRLAMSHKAGSWLLRAKRRRRTLLPRSSDFEVLY